MLNVKISANQPDTGLGNNGLLKEVNGVNGTPISIAPGFPDLQDQFNQMGIKHIRLHDVFGVGDLDNYFDASRQNNQNQLIPNVPAEKQQGAKQFIASFANARTIYPNAALGMRNNDVDLAFKDANYQTTDYYIGKILHNDPALNPTGIQREVMFRIGRTLDGGAELPENFDIYATLVSTLVDRYSANYGKANLPRKVKYWEIWNEPDLTFFWNSNDPQKYYQFYAKVARMIKAVDPAAKVGGAGVANGYNPGGAYLDGLLDYCKKNGVPLDFLSWHYYGNITSDPQNIIDIANSINTSLATYGYSGAESICTEWNSSPFGTVNTFTKVQSARNASYIASSLIYMQRCKVDKAYYYRGDGSSFGLFNDNPNPADPKYKAFCTYSAQAFHLFSKMFDTPSLLAATNTLATGLSVLAGRKDRRINIIVANHRVDASLSNGDAAPPNGVFYAQYYLDSGRTIAAITDGYSIEHWFGGRNPAGLYNNNQMTPHATADQLPVKGSLRAWARNYAASQGGVELEINGLDRAFSSLKAYRIKQGGALGGMLPREVTGEVGVTNNGTSLILRDANATEYTVTLFCIELGNAAPLPTPTPAPTGFTHSYTFMRPSGRHVLGFGPEAERFYLDLGDVCSINVASSPLRVTVQLHDYADKFEVVSESGIGTENNTVVLKFKSGGKFADVMRDTLQLVYKPPLFPVLNKTTLTIVRTKRG